MILSNIDTICDNSATVKYDNGQRRACISQKKHIEYRNNRPYFISIENKDENGIKYSYTLVTGTTIPYKISISKDGLFYLSSYYLNGAFFIKQRGLEKGDIREEYNYYDETFQIKSFGFYDYSEPETIWGGSSGILHLKKMGKWYYFSEFGEIIKEEIWENGKLIEANPPNMEECESYWDTKLEKRIYTEVEEFPKYPSGINKFLRLSKKNYVKPKQKKGKKLMRIFVIIDINGKIISKGIVDKKEAEYSLKDKEILRIVSLMSDWNVGKCQGIAVPVKIILHLENW